MSSKPTAVAVLAWLTVSGWPLQAASAPSSRDCKSIDEAMARLACYDEASGRSAATPNRAATPAEPDSGEASGAGFKASNSAAPAEPAGGLALSSAWELDPGDKRGTFKLLPHRLNYLLPARYSTRVNDRPQSPAPDHGLSADQRIQSVEAKFQLSFKVKAWENIFGDNGDLWLAYTQQSNWQLYNRDQSSPFRETDYEPEAILALRTDAEMFGWRWRMVNFGIAHQSNGRPLPLSRSWNRIYAQFGLERGDWTLLARPWFRLPERTSRDDNPDIRDYLGSGDLRLAYRRNGYVYSVLGRYSPSRRRGFTQLEWAFPLSGALRGYVQATSGYGESLIDYNHSQTTVGVGVLLLPWQ